MKKFIYIILGILLGLGATVYGATVFNSNQVGTSPSNGFILQTNGTISTWVANTGGNFPFTSVVGYNSTSTVIGFLNGLFSTASTTFSSNVFFPALSQGLGYIGSNGLFQSTATTSVTCTGNVSCTAFTAIGAAPITINGTGSTFSGAAFSVVVTDGSGGLIATGTQLTVGSILATTTNDNIFRGRILLPNLSQGFAGIGSAGQIYTFATSSINLSGFNNDLANLTAGNTSLTLSGSYNGSTARTAVLNVGNTNTWSVLQNFNYSSTSIYASFVNASSTNYLGGGLATCTGNNFLQYTSSNFFSCTAGNAGTVTAIGVTANQGVTGSSSGGATPNLTISLGALTGVTSLNGLVVTANTGVITSGTWNGSTIDVAHGGTNKTSYPSNSFITSDSAGTSLIATTSDITVSSLLATSTIGWSVFLNDGVAIGTSSPTSPWLLNISTSTVPQLSLQAGAGIAQWAFRNAGSNFYLSTTTVAGTATTSISALEISGSGFGTTTVRGLNISAQATTTSNVGFSITNGCYAIGTTCLSTSGSGLSSYDAWTHSTIFLNNSATTSKIGIGTTTPYYDLTIASTTGSQFALSAGTGIAQWVQRNAGGNFYLGTTTVAGTATSSISALEIDGTTGTTTLRGLNIVGYATSTSNVGYNITTGCYAISTVCVGGTSFSNTIANGGTGSTAFAGNSIITSNSAGTALIATGTQLTVGNILATTTAVNSFAGVIVAPDGTLSNPAFSFADDQNNGIYSPANDIFAILTNGVERFRINDSSGFSAFGTTTQGLSILTLGTSTGPQLALSSNTGGVAQWTFRNASANLYIGLTNTTGTATTSTPAITWLSNGFEGLGTSTPPSNLTLGATSAQLISTTPLFLLGTSTLSGASAGGTYFAINSPTGFAGDYLNIQNNNTASLKVSQSSSGFGVFALGTTTFGAVPGKLVIATSTTAQLTLTDGLGGSTPFNFRVVGSTFNLSTSSVNSQATSTGSVMRVDSTGGVFFNGTANSGASQTGYWCYDANGQLIRDTAVCLVSARKFKTDIKPLTVGLDDLEKMDFVSYLKKEPLSSEDSHRQMGVIADDVAEINPALNEMLVTYVGGGTSGEVHAFRYDQFTALLGQSIKDLSAKVKNIKGVARSAEENWQWIAMFIMFCWIIRLEIKTRK